MRWPRVALALSIAAMLSCAHAANVAPPGAVRELEPCPLELWEAKARAVHAHLIAMEAAGVPLPAVGPLGPQDVGRLLDWMEAQLHHCAYLDERIYGVPPP